MKRILSLLLALAMMIGLLPAVTLPVNAATATGTCGDNLTWSISDNTLTISGTGPMYDYSADSTWAPWWKYAEDITCIVIENGVTTIGDWAFWQNLYNVSSITIPDSVTYIGESAMCNFPFIRESKTFTIPAGVQSVAPDFLDSGFVEKIEVDPNNPYLCAVDGVLYNKDQTVLYYCPRAKTSVNIPDTVTTIKDRAFLACDITSIDLPDNLTTIEAQAFKYCTQITSVTIPDGVTRLEDSTFSGCWALANIALHNNITYIGNDAFLDTAIINISLPNKLTAINPCTFMLCEQLETIYIPISIKSIGNAAFAGCNAFIAYYEGSSVEWNSVSVADENEQLLANLQFEASAPPTSNLLVKTGEFQYNNSFTDTTWTFPYSYDESWFFEDNDVYQHDLCKMSLRVALAAFGDTDSGNGPANIKALMDNLGFSYTEDSVSYPNPTYDTMGYAIGRKTLVNTDGEACSLILVAVRGGAYGVEWGGNFQLGLGEDHEGFSSGSITVLEGLERYLEVHENELEDTVKVWIVGYSRGAAVANLTAARLNDGYEDICSKMIKRDNVYAYCFECPKNTTAEDAHADQYNNIMSIVNPIDFVTKVAMEDWGFDRYGQVFRLPGLEYTASYNDRKTEMIDCYEDILDENDYTLGALEDPYIEVKDQASALDIFMSHLCTAAVSRENYHQNMEIAVMKAAGDALGGAGWAHNIGNFVQTLVDISGMRTYAINTPYVVTLFVGGIGPKAHYPELCMAWLDSLDQSWFNSFGKIEDAIAWMDQAERRKYLIACPVDVEVYNADGNLVAQILDDEVQDIENGLAAYLDDDGQKVVVLPGDGEYEVKIIATDDGTVSCTVEEFASNDTMTRTVSYFDIAIEKEDVLYSTAAIPTEEEAAAYPLTLPDGSIAEVSADQEPVTHTVELTATGHGTASGPATKIEGEYVIVRAEPDENESFLGWYNGETLVSEDAEYRFRVEADVSLTATFTAEYHTWDEGSEIAAPTCTEPGEALYTCTVCQATKTEPIAKTGHSYDIGVITTPPTATEAGIKTFTCGACGGSYTESVPATGETEQPFDPDAVPNPFTDVKKGAFYYTPVLWAVSEGVTSGLTPTTFGPGDNCTRGQVVTFLWRAAGCPAPKATSCPFIDVSTGAYYYKAMMWAVENGITSGTSATTFAPNDRCTRAQVVTFLWRAAGKPAAGTTKCAFTDVSDSGFYYKAMMWAVDANVTSGTSATTFAPDDTCTRGQVVTFLYRAYN